MPQQKKWEVGLENMPQVAFKFPLSTQHIKIEMGEKNFK